MSLLPKVSRFSLNSKDDIGGLCYVRWLGIGQRIFAFFYVIVKMRVNAVWGDVCERLYTSLCIR